MKILLFGKGGQVGWELQRSLAPLGELVAVDFDSTEHCGDFTRLGDLEATVHAVRPDVIVNAAAHTAVDRAESEPGLVKTLNATAPGVLGTIAKELGAWLVHYSTDYVFDGSGQRPWLETDTPAPLNVYGHTKQEAEVLIAASGCNHLIFRTSWVFGARGGNFAKTMIKLAQERPLLSVIQDQHGAPTGAELLSDVTALALQRVVASGGEAYSGLYHLAASGQTTWYDYARHVIDHARDLRPDLAWRVQEVLPVASDAFKTAAKRPLNSLLNTGRIQRVLGVHLPDWKAGVDRMLSEYLQLK